MCGPHGGAQPSQGIVPCWQTLNQSLSMRWLKRYLLLPVASIRPHIKRMTETLNFRFPITMGSGRAGRLASIFLKSLRTLWFLRRTSNTRCPRTSSLILPLLGLPLLRRSRSSMRLLRISRPLRAPRSPTFLVANRRTQTMKVRVSILVACFVGVIVASLFALVLSAYWPAA